MHELLYIGLIPEPIKEFKEHGHINWEIVYYTHGMGFVKVGLQEIPFHPRTIVCLPPDILHTEYSDTGYRNIHFAVRTFNSWGDEIPQFQDNDSNDFFNILAQMHREFVKKQNNWQGITENLLGVLYQYMLAWHCENTKNPWVERFENILVSNISNCSFNLLEEMGKVPLSKDHFRKIFRTETGKTPLQYLTEKRLEHAMKLLELGSRNHLQISEIARMAGYPDPYYFSRIFKKHVGKSPFEYASHKMEIPYRAAP